MNLERVPEKEKTQYACWVEYPECGVVRRGCPLLVHMDVLRAVQLSKRLVVPGNQNALQARCRRAIALLTKSVSEKTLLRAEPGHDGASLQLQWTTPASRGHVCLEEKVTRVEISGHLRRRGPAREFMPGRTRVRIFS